MIPYLFHVSILLAGCYTFYWLFLRQETFFQLNRAILLVCLLLPLGLPLVTIPANWSLELFPVDKISSIQQPSLVDLQSPKKEVALAPKEQKTPESSATSNLNDSNHPVETKKSLSIREVFTYLYFTGVLIFSLAFFIQLVLIMAKRNTLNIIKDGKYKIVELVKEEAPFSFWSNIFINPASYDPDTYEQILAHEKIHIDQAHFIDKLLAEFFLIAFWFNPFIWLFRKVISNNLEYLTDQSMLNKGFQKQVYQMSLFKVSAPQFPLNLTTNYNQSFLKNRIAMMNTKKSSARSIWKYLFILPLLGFSMMSLNTVHTNDEDANSISIEHQAPEQPTENSKTKQPVTPTKVINQPTKKTIPTNKKTNNKTANKVNNLLDYGLWEGVLNNGEVCFYLNHAKKTIEPTRRICYLKKQLNGFTTEREGKEFSIKQEQGTLLMEGTFSNGKGQGIFKFKPNPAFVKFLKSEKRLEIADQNLLLLFFHDIDKAYIKNAIRQTINKGIERHSISVNEDDHIFAIINPDSRSSIKGSKPTGHTTTNSVRSSNKHSDGQVHIETINGKTFIHGKGTHNVNGTIITITGDETWVVEANGDFYQLENDTRQKDKRSTKRKTPSKSYNKVQPTNGLEKHYLEQSKRKGHLDWIGYSTTILEPSTNRMYQLPAFCKEFRNELIKDEIIDAGDKIMFYFGERGAYVNGWHLSGGHATKFRNMANKYDIQVSKGWNIELEGQNVLVTGSVRDVDQLRIDLRRALTQDGLVKSGEREILTKISGNRFIVNGQDIPREKMSSYFQLLRRYHITPAPGKIIQMGSKKHKNLIHVGYGGDNSFLGTFSTD